MVLHTRGRVGRRHFTKALSSNELGAFSLCMLISNYALIFLLLEVLPLSHDFSSS